MAEKLELDLTLNDQASVTARKVVEALKGAESQAKKTSNKWGQQWENTFAKIATAEVRSANKAAGQRASQAAKEAAKYEKAWTSTFARIATAEHKKRTSAPGGGGHGGFGAGFAEEMGKSLSFGKLASAAAVGGVVAGAIIEGATKAVEIFAEGIKFAFESAGKKETQNLAYRLTLGGNVSKEALEDAEKIGKLLNKSGSKVAEEMLPLYNAGLKPGKAAQQAYALAADIAARQGTTNKGGIEENVAMISKMMLKGGISEKMLVGLKAERVQEFYKNVAKIIHTDVDSAKKAISAGKVDPQILMNELSRATNKQQGGGGGSGAAAAGQLFESRMANLKNLPEQFFERMVDNPGFLAVSKSVEDLFKGLDPDSANGKLILTSLNNAMTDIGKTVKDAMSPENIKQFSLAISNVAEGIAVVVKGLVKTAEIVGQIINLGDNLAGKDKNPNVDKAVADVAKLSVDLDHPEKFFDAANSIRGGLTASEKVDFDNRTNHTMDTSENKKQYAELDYNMAAPKVASGGGGKTIIHAPIKITAHKGETERAAKQTQRALSTLSEQGNQHH